MAKERRSYSSAEEVSLTSEVDGCCPLCDAPLFYAKSVGKPGRARHFKAFEIAHIYPLNPTPAELRELDGVDLLSSDPNDLANLIALCLACHGRFDKPRTRSEYDSLLDKKRQLLGETAQRALRTQFPIERDIHEIIVRLHQHESDTDAEAELAYDPKALEAKLDAQLPRPTRHKIRSAVSAYYGFIRREFAELERRSPTASILIFTQVRVFYLKQKSLGLPQATVFANTVRWIHERAKPATLDAAELLAAFFVQNCEVFE